MLSFIAVSIKKEEIFGLVEFNICLPFLGQGSFLEVSHFICCGSITKVSTVCALDLSYIVTISAGSVMNSFAMLSTTDPPPDIVFDWHRQYT